MSECRENERERLSLRSRGSKEKIFRWGMVRALFLAMAASMVVVAGVFWKSEALSQPIQFNHKLHTKDLDIPCTDCHRYVKSAEFAGRPVTKICATCHDPPQTNKPEEARLIKYIKSGEEIPWRRLYEVPSHVFYSHRRHVTVAKLECAVCHGEIGQSVAPPARPLRTLSMDFCIDCHEQRKVTTDCNACHR